MFTFGVKNLNKSIGHKDLMVDVSFDIYPREKIGFIGRNGEGKSTLLKILSGEDTDFTAEIEKSNNIRILLTKQEHHDILDITPLEYATNGNEEYARVKNKITSYELEPDKEVGLEEYCDLIAIFGEKGFYHLEEKVLDTLKKIGITDAGEIKMETLSGGQKRMVEMVKVKYSDAHVVLMDEPTNHLDYKQKENFLKMLEGIDKTFVIVTHDRDVLDYVDRILELKNKEIVSYPGSYENYIRQNKTKNISSINDYESRLKKAEELEKQHKKLKQTLNVASRATKILLDRIEREKSKAQENLEKPDFWIDKESQNSLDKGLAEKYETYKSQNIKLDVKSGKMVNENLVSVNKLSLSYDGITKLFDEISFDLSNSDRLELRGLNGAGKTTFVKKILELYEAGSGGLHTKENRIQASTKSSTSSFNATLVQETVDTSAEIKIMHGSMYLSQQLEIGLYRQEFQKEELSKTIEDVIRKEFYSRGLGLTNQHLSKILSDFLFDPVLDKGSKLENLSGGQKARVQLMKMVSTNPNLLILDEPTNHLDLPSIEELEEVLKNFSGAIMYITHDSFFRESMGGKVVEVLKS